MTLNDKIYNRMLYGYTFSKLMEMYHVEPATLRYIKKSKVQEIAENLKNHPQYSNLEKSVFYAWAYANKNETQDIIGQRFGIDNKKVSSIVRHMMWLGYNEELDIEKTAPQKRDGRTKMCNHCRKIIPSFGEFCPYCGKKVYTVKDCLTQLENQILEASVTQAKSDILKGINTLDILKGLLL